MPNFAKHLALVVALGVSVEAAQAQTTMDVSNQGSNLSLSSSWTPQAVPTGNDAAVWDSSSVTTSIVTPLIDNFTIATTSFGSINLNKWNKTVNINSNGSTNLNNNTLSLVSNPSVSTTSVGLNIGNLNINPSSGGGATFNLLHAMTITGALGTASSSPVNVTVNDGGPLNLIGSSNSGSAATGQVNLAFQNNTALTLGNNTPKTFGLLTINGNTSLTQDNKGAPSVLNNPNNNSSFAVTANSQATFTGGLNIVAGTLSIYGWQGTQLGATSSGEQLLFGNAGLTTGVELTDVIFDLATNQAGPTGSTYDLGKGAQYDYGEWISDPSDSSLDELVPYAAVPEPRTILAALVVLGAVTYRERRRFAALAGFFSKRENCL